MRLANLFADTIDAQTHALDSFARFQDAIRTIGPDLNAISANSNLALPEFNQARGDYTRLLANPQAVRRQPGRHAPRYRPDIDAILTQGDNVVRVLSGSPGRHLQTPSAGRTATREVLEERQPRDAAQRLEVRLDFKNFVAVLRRPEPGVRVAGAAASRAPYSSSPCSRPSSTAADRRLLGLFHPVDQRQPAPEAAGSR